MQQIKKIAEIEVTMHVCDVCKKEYNYYNDARKCERIHKEESCKHKNIFFDIDMESEYSIEVTKQCRECNKHLENAKIINISDISEEIAKALFNME